MLSDVACRQAKPKDKDFKLADRDGLYLLVKTSGTRLWRYDYRYAGKRKTLSMGVYPEVSLPEAREALKAARKLLKAGTVRRDQTPPRYYGRLELALKACDTAPP